MKRFLILWVTSCCVALSAGNFLLEVETLTDAGKWIVGDAALASGKRFLSSGEKKCTASGRYEIPETGTYYLWVRNLSFSQKWRKSSVVIDGIASGAVGDEATTLDTPAWIWTRVKKPFFLKKGVHDISLRGESASVRVDCLLFTTEKDFVPQPGALPEAGRFAVLLPEGVLRGKISLDVTTGKGALEYRCSEKMIFSLSPRLDEKTLEKGRIVYRLRGDDGQEKAGEFVLEKGKAVYSLEVALSRPGFVRLTADLVDENGEKLRGVDADGRVSFGHFDGGAGADVGRIETLPEPEDFDAFWTKQKARLAAVPLRAEVKKLAAYSDEEFETFAVSVDCAGDRPATGFLVMPVGAAPGSLEAEIHFEGYGIGIPAVPGSHRRREDAMVFFVNAHGTPLEASPRQYAEFFAARKDYALRGNGDAGTCYFNGMALRVLRACQYLESRPEWDGKVLEVVGGSQGGLQAIWAAALDGKVSRCAIEVPWNCNMGGRTFKGMMAPEWGIEKYENALAYYDPVHWAERIACPVEISRAGLGDYICPPSGIACFYRRLKCPKKIVWYQNTNHGFAPENAEKWTFQEF